MLEADGELRTSWLNTLGSHDLQNVNQSKVTTGHAEEVSAHTAYEKESKEFIGGGLGHWAECRAVHVGNSGTGVGGGGDRQTLGTYQLVSLHN